MKKAKETFDNRHSFNPILHRRLMQKIKQKNSAPEIALRSSLHRAGLRYRIHVRIEKVNVDIACTSSRIAIFVDGCFWHGCPIHATYPKSNTEYWLPKLRANKERDLRQTELLENAGWKVVRVWEHECTPPTGELIAQIVSIYKTRRKRTD